MGTDCTVCGLALISSPHLVRSYHHVFPVPEFKEIMIDDDDEDDDDVAIQQLHISDNPEDFVICFGCQTTLDVKKNLMETCQKCNNPFCIECNVFIHESLHNCPGC